MLISQQIVIMLLIVGIIFDMSDNRTAATVIFAFCMGVAFTNLEYTIREIIRSQKGDK